MNRCSPRWPAGCCSTNGCRALSFAAARWSFCRCWPRSFPRAARVGTRPADALPAFEGRRTRGEGCAQKSVDKDRSGDANTVRPAGRAARCCADGRRGFGTAKAAPAMCVSGARRPLARHRLRPMRFRHPVGGIQPHRPVGAVRAAFSRRGRWTAALRAALRRCLGKLRKLYMASHALGALPWAASFGGPERRDASAGR